MSVVPYRSLPQTDRQWVSIMGPAIELAQAVADTEFVPRDLRGRPAAICAAILYGDEVGLPPMMALSRIAVVDGRPALYAEAMRALIRAAGHDLWPEEQTNTRFTWAGRRAGEQNVVRVTWTMDDAKAANLAGKPTYRAYPRQMLSARATAELARLHFADVIGGLAVVEELEDGAELGAAPAVSEPAVGPATTRRRRVGASTLAAVPPPREAPTQGPQPPLPGEDDESGPASAPDGEPALLEPITDAQLKKLQTLFRERGYATASDRHRYATLVIGRPVASSRQLTAADATRLIELLEVASTPQAPADAAPPGEAPEAPPPPDDPELTAAPGRSAGARGVVTLFAEHDEGRADGAPPTITDRVVEEWGENLTWSFDEDGELAAALYADVAKRRTPIRAAAGQTLAEVAAGDLRLRRMACRAPNDLAVLIMRRLERWWAERDADTNPSAWIEVRVGVEEDVAQTIGFAPVGERDPGGVWVYRLVVPEADPDFDLPGGVPDRAEQAAEFDRYLNSQPYSAERREEQDALPGVDPDALR